MELPFGLAAHQGLWLAAGLLGASYVRGFSGFGFSAIFIAFAALFTNPVPLIPAIFVCEIVMTTFLVKAVWHDVDWARVAALTLGAAVAIVPSVWVMARLDPEVARVVVAGLIFCLGLFLLSGWQMTRPVGRAGFAVAGGVSGMINAAGIGGLPAAAFLTAQPMTPATFRAVLVIYLCALDMMSLPVMGLNGLVSSDTFVGAALAFPILGLGIWLGHRGFGRISPQAFRRFAILILLFLSALALTRAVI